MKCHACQVLNFEPIDAVQKLASSDSGFSQTLGTSLAISRKAISKAASAKKIGDGIRTALNSLPTRIRRVVDTPRTASVLHNSLYILHNSLQDLQISAQGGCEFCRLIWGGLQEVLDKPEDKIYSSSADVRLYLSAYQALDFERTLSPLNNQYITVECGSNRSMCLEITAGEVESLGSKFSVQTPRTALLTRAVRGFPRNKPPKADGNFDVDWVLDMTKLHVGKSQYTANGNVGTSFDFIPEKRTRNQMIESHFVTMDSLNGPLEYLTYSEGSEAIEDQHTGSKINLKRAIGWLNTCQQSHELCTCTIDPLTALPTRVIDLGPPNSTQPPFLYRSKREYANYCTLSHRWAGKSVVRTLSDNVKLHEKELPLQELSATFRDAIEICRELCIRYLWIDSLCIIQDSREDWAQESAKMGDYYWNSFVTIAADHASEGNEGCFRRRDPCSIQPCLISFTFPQEIDRAKAAVRVAPRIQEGTDWRHKEYSILDTRSWVLQERVLSPRTLFFGEHQLSFSCISMRASESNPEGSDRTSVRVQAPFEEFQRKIRNFALAEGKPNAIAADSKALKAATITSLPRGETTISVEPGVNGEVDQESFIELHDNWYELLQEYNKRSITQKSDVLPAISGLAQRFHKILGETYLAGHWSGDLKFGLLWSVDESSQRPDEYIAPSWSWASVRTCQLLFNFNYERATNGNLCRILKAEVTTCGSDIYGQVTKGRLYVQGLLKMATVVVPPKAAETRNNKYVPDTDVRYDGGNWLLFREMYNNRELEKGECAYLEDSDTEEKLCKFEPDGDFDATNPLVFCLPIVLQKTMLDDDQAALCLVLQPIHIRNSIWRRVGFARIHKVDWFKDAPTGPLIIE